MYICVCQWVSEHQKTARIDASIAEKDNMSLRVKVQTVREEKLRDGSLIHWAVRSCQSACRYANAAWQGTGETSRLTHTPSSLPDQNQTRHTPFLSSDLETFLWISEQV